MSNYEFGGVGHAEALDRKDEYRTGVPGQGSGEVLLSCPAQDSRQRLSKVSVLNSGEESAFLAMKHQGATKALADGGRWLTAMDQGSNRVSGKLAQKSIVAGSVVIQEAGALANIVDNGLGVLHDVGVPANTRGTINYATGDIDFTWGGAATEPQLIDFNHTDFTDFVSAAQSQTFTATGSYPETFTTSIGRLAPGFVTLGDGALTFVDDGRGVMVETTAGNQASRGTVDYATGVVTLTSGSATLATGAGATTVGSRYNPFSALLSKAGGATVLSLFSAMLPELTTEVWADGIKGESKLGLWGESRSNTQTNLMSQWWHSGEDPFRVDAPFSGFPAGGESNS